MQTVKLGFITIGMLIFTVQANASWYVGKTFSTMVSQMAINFVTIQEDGNLKFTEVGADGAGEMYQYNCNGTYTDSDGLIETKVSCPDEVYTQKLQLKDVAEADVAAGTMLYVQSSLFGEEFIPAPFLLVEPQVWTMETVEPIMMKLAEIAMTWEPEE